MAGKVSKAKQEAVSFEERLEQLEGLAQKMEQGNLPLHELLQDYEEGMRLSAGLQAELAQARARMMEIKQNGGAGQKPQPSELGQQASLLDELDASQEKE
ncbi:MAG: exodeoxyribonuclease VII small subunit [Candidatus Limiplasma sp.]|nr:exodeoxyribonuclease VII small subunit [Candidatus Limiplasma sp.]